MSLDFSKPVRTRDGREVRILCADASNSKPVIGYYCDLVVSKDEFGGVLSDERSSYKWLR